MLQDYSTKSVHIQDQGLFMTELARVLSRYFGKVTVSSPWISSFPGSEQTEIGDGFKEFERVDNIEDIKDDVDLFVFPDIYYGSVQLDLISQGKRVWGSRAADELEIYRDESKEYCDSLGIPQGDWDVVDGIEALYKLASKTYEKLWIKINKTRKDMESFSIEGMKEEGLTALDLYENRLDDLKARLGPKAKITKFIVEKDLPGTLDLAIDTHSVNGQYPTIAALGTEEKGECYVCSIKPWNEMPKGLVSIYDKLSETLREYGYANFLSLESRVKGQSILLGDPCKRMGSPPAELEMKMIKNLPDIFWYGAEGTLIDPVYAGKYGVQLNVHSDWANEHPLIIAYPEKVRDNLAFRYDSLFDGRTWIMPQGAGPRVAAITSFGDSIDGCMDECSEISKQLKGIQIESFTRAFPIIKDKIKQFGEWDIKF